MDDLGGFIKQVPIGLLLAPVFFLVLYIILMVIIFQRAAAKRRARQAERDQQLNAMGGVAPDARPVSAALPPTPARRPAAAPAVPRQAAAAPILAAQMSPGVPAEPDLDLLAPPPFVPFAPLPAVPIAAASGTAPATPEIAPAPTPAEPVAAITPTDQIVEFNAMPVPTPDSANAPADSVEVLRVWRDLSDGSLIIQMGSAQYRTIDAIIGADMTRRFSALVRELSAMASAATAPSAAVEGPGARGKIGLLNQAQPEETPPKSGVFRQLGRAAIGQNAAAGKAEKRPDGIANAVEEFLQYKLTDHPEFSTRSIHIRPASDGGVRIEVDGRSWDGIGDVADPAVREFLLSVMREWEARQ